MRILPLSVASLLLVAPPASLQAAEVYHGAVHAGRWQPALQLHARGDLRLGRVGNGAAMAALDGGKSATAWTLRYDAERALLQWPSAAAGVRAPLPPDFNTLRIRTPDGRVPASLQLHTGAEVHALDTHALAAAGALTVFSRTLAEGFELRAGPAQPDGSGQPGLQVDVGDVALVHLPRDSDGQVSVLGGETLCTTSDCSQRAVVLDRGGYLALQAERDPQRVLEFTGWGNDCRGQGRVVSHGLDPARDEFWCAAGFARRGAQAKGGVTALFTNAAALTVPGAGSSGIASLYPSNINVSATGPIADVRVTLRDVSHTHPDDLDILLLPPRTDEFGIILMSDACGSDDIAEYEWTFSDAAPAPMTDSILEGCFPFVVRPTNFGSGDTWAAPAPAEPYASALSSADNDNPIGAWSLYVVDDAGGDTGSIASGWSLAIDVAPHEFLIPGSGTSGPAGSYPAETVVSGHGLQISDVNLVLDGVSHTFPDDIDMLLVSPAGTAVLVMSDACGGSDITGYFWRFDDEAAAPLSDSTLEGCIPFDVRPTNYGDADSFIPPAPAAPYATSLSAFDGENPNGTWRLYVVDDVGGDGGYLRTGWSLEITTSSVFRDGFETP